MDASIFTAANTSSPAQGFLAPDVFVSVVSDAQQSTFARKRKYPAETESNPTKNTWVSVTKANLKCVTQSICNNKEKIFILQKDQTGDANIE